MALESAALTTDNIGYQTAVGLNIDLDGEGLISPLQSQPQGGKLPPLPPPTRNACVTPDPDDHSPRQTKYEPIPKGSKCALVCCPICGGYWDYPIDDWGRSKILPPHKNYLTGKPCPGSGKLPVPISVTDGSFAHILATSCGLHTILI